MITEKQELFTPEFSVRFVTRRMIIEKQKLFTPFLVRFVTWRMIIEGQELFNPGSSLKTGGKQFLLLYDHPSCNEPHWKPRMNSSCFSMIIRHVTNLTENRGYMTNDPREAGTVYPQFSVRFVTWRMILETGTVYPRFSVRFVAWRMILETGTVYPQYKQFLLLYDHPSCNEPHWKPGVNSSCPSMIIRHVTNRRNCLPPFSVRFVTWRMILEKQELFIPGFQWSSLHDGWS
jgi:hypothetical protein